MLKPDYLQDMPGHIMDIFNKLEEQIIEDIARRIKEGMELSETADYQMNIMAELGYGLSDIKKEISKATKLGEKEIEKILKESSYLSHENDTKLYKVGRKVLPEMDPAMHKFIKASIKQTKGELRNLTKTMGFIDNGKFKLIDSFYKDTLDYAVFQLGSGAFDYNTILRQAVRKLGDSGVRTIDYKSGRSYHIESAVRMTVMTGSSQINGHISEINADMMDQDLMEITSHIGARPSHSEWQGQIISRSGNSKYLSLGDIGYGEGGGFKGWNCRHDWFPFFEGISEPSKRAVDPPDFEYNDKTYTAYDATQKQRYIERQIRQSKRELIAYDASGLKDEFTAASIKLNRQRKEYKKFSNAAKLRPKNERHQVYKYGRSISGKAVNAAK